MLAIQHQKMLTLAKTKKEKQSGSQNINDII